MLYILLTLISLFEPKLTVKNFAATFEEEGFIIIESDSIHRWKNNRWKTTKLIKSSFSIRDKIALNLNNEVYLISRGVGLVYRLQGDSIIRIDRSFDWRSRYNTNFFFKDNKIYSLGGYGLWTLKNNLIYFDEKAAEWSLEEYVSAEDLPEDISGGFFQLSDSILYYGPSSLMNKEENSTVYQYNFNKRTWSTLGKGSSQLKLINSNRRTYLDLPYVFNKQGQIGQMNFIDNEFKFYTQPNAGILKDAKSIIGNPNSREFMILTENGENIEVPVILGEQELLGNNYKSTPLYKTSKEWNFFIFLFIGIFSTAGFFAFRRNKNLYAIIQENKSSIYKQLTNDEKYILDALLNQYPKSVQMPIILSEYSKKLTYESKVKKFRKSLSNIEYIISNETKYKKGPIILDRRNKEDKRIKELYLNK